MAITENPVPPHYSRFSSELASQDSWRAARSVADRWMAALSAIQSAIHRPAAAVTRPSRESDIGVWKRVVQDGAAWFVQRGANPSQTARIGPKQGGKRVVLIGESVANGYPFSPAFSCAGVLKRLLDGAGAENVEVVDLTVIGLRFPLLLQIIESSYQLEPDAYIVFAGNNWHLSDQPKIDLDRLAAQLRESGSWQAVGSYFDDLMRQQVSALVGKLGALRASQNVPVVFVIPEFNLKDWPYAANWCNPLVAGTIQTRWFETWRRAEAAFKGEEIDHAERLANQLVEVEEGLSVLGLRLLGLCALKRGDVDRARYILAQSRDVCRSHTLIGVFGCCSSFQHEIRRRACAEGIDLVDLPQLFSEANPRDVPGRELFVDSVHLTPEGIRLAMSWVCETILPLLGAPARGFSDLMKIPVDISPRSRALGYFVAGIINDGCGDAGEDLVRYYYREALKHAPETADLIRLYVDFRSRRAPDVLCSSFHEFLSQSAKLGIVLPAVNSPQKQLGQRQLRIIVEEVSSALPCLKDDFENLLRDDHAVETRVDLLHSRFESTRLQQGYYDDGSHFIAYTPCSRFLFMSGGNRPIWLHLTLRVDNRRAVSKPIRLSSNGQMIDSHAASMQWDSWCVVLDPKRQKAGLNELIIHWPQVKESKADRVRQICESLERPPILDNGYIPNVYPVFGEIHTFTAEPVPQPALHSAEERILVAMPRHSRG